MSPESVHPACTPTAIVCACPRCSPGSSEAHEEPDSGSDDPSDHRLRDSEVEDYSSDDDDEEAAKPVPGDGQISGDESPSPTHSQSPTLILGEPTPEKSRKRQIQDDESPDAEKARAKLCSCLLFLFWLLFLKDYICLHFALAGTKGTASSGDD